MSILEKSKIPGFIGVRADMHQAIGNFFSYQLELYLIHKKCLPSFSRGIIFRNTKQVRLWHIRSVYTTREELNITSYNFLHSIFDSFVHNELNILDREGTGEGNFFSFFTKWLSRENFKDTESIQKFLQKITV